METPYAVPPHAAACGFAELPPSALAGLLTQERTLAELKGITPADLMRVYADAHERLMHGHAAQALDDLALLVVHNPWDARFQFALALALQQLDRHEAALPHYLLAVQIDPNDSACTLRLGECLEALDELRAAQEAFRRCIELSWQSAGHDEVRHYAQLALERIDAGGHHGR